MGEEKKFMREALRLALLMEGRTSPDPMVGAVIVKRGRIVGKGYHKEVCSPHAEAVALDRAGSSAKGATLFVTLEPCSHYGNNPPCSDRIIGSGIKKVVAAMKDPNPLVQGRGFAKLRRAGIRVEVGLLGDEAKEANAAFTKFITKKMPFVILKSAMSLDGKIATEAGESRWISSEASRKIVHALRSKVDAVVTSVKTVRTDDPLLDARMVRGRDPLKVVIDPMGDTPINSKILRNKPWRAVIVVGQGAPRAKLKKLEGTGAEVIQLRGRSARIDLKKAMAELAKKGIMSVMMEAGGGLSSRALRSGIVDKAMYFVAPKLIGGKRSPTPFDGSGVGRLKDAIRLKDFKFSRIGDDILIEGSVVN